MKLLFLHGLGQDKKSFDKVIENIEYSDIESADLMDIDEKLTFSKVVNNIETKYSKRDDQLIICGLSLGSIVAMEYYLNNKQQVKALILIAPQYKMPKKTLKFQNLIFKILPNRVFDKMGISRENIISISNSMMDLDYSKSLDKIKSPVFIICGDKDRANLKAAKLLKEKIESSELMIIENVGHEVNVKAPIELAECISKILTILKVS